MLVKQGVFTRTWVAALLAGAIAGPALGAVIISDNFDDTNTAEPQPTDIYWMDASVTDNTTGLGGYTAGSKNQLPNLWLPMMGMYNTWIQEKGGKLVLTTRDSAPEGAAIYTGVNNSLNFFDRGIQVMVRGIEFTGTSHPSYQYFKLMLSPQAGTMAPSSYVSILLNGENNFSMARDEAGIIKGPAEIVGGAHLPDKVKSFDLRINDTRYEVIFYWDTGAIYYCGNHNLVKQGTGGGWQVPTSRFDPPSFGPTSVILYGGYRGPATRDRTASQVSLDNVTITDWVTTPTTPSMCVVPTPQ